MNTEHVQDQWSGTGRIHGAVNLSVKRVLDAIAKRGASELSAEIVLLSETLQALEKEADQIRHLLTRLHAVEGDTQQVKEQVRVVLLHFTEDESFDAGLGCWFVTPSDTEAFSGAAGPEPVEEAEKAEHTDEVSRDRILGEHAYLHIRRSIYPILQEALNARTAEYLTGMINKLERTLFHVEKEAHHIRFHLAEIYDVQGDAERASEFIEAALLHYGMDGALNPRRFTDFFSSAVADFDYLTSAEDFLRTNKVGLKAAYVLESIQQKRRRAVQDTAQSDIEVASDEVELLCKIYDDASTTDRDKWVSLLIDYLANLRKRRQEFRKMERDAQLLSDLMVELLLRITEHEGEEEFKRFKNSYDLFRTLRLQPGLWHRVGGIEGVRDLIRRAYKTGVEYASCVIRDEDADEEHGGLFFQVGIVCQAFSEESIFRDVEVENFEEKMRSGIYFLELALNNDTTENIHANYPLGKCFQALGEYEEALECYISVLEAPSTARIRKSTRFHVHREMARCYESLGFESLKKDRDIDKAKQFWDLAENHYFRAHRVNEPNPEVPPWKTGDYILLSSMADFYMRTHCPGKALPYYESIMDSEPSAAPESKGKYDLYSYRWGVALIYCGEHEKALAKLEEVLARDPADKHKPKIYGQLIRVCSILKDKEGIQEIIERYQQERFAEADSAPSIPKNSDIVLEKDQLAKAEFSKQCINKLESGRYREVIVDIRPYTE